MPRLHQIIPALLAVVIAFTPAVSFADISISINLAPPALPIYVQPLPPAPSYIWAPGYWAYSPVGYYWVPGTWVLAPAPGLLWTPPYWGWRNGEYIFNEGYWAPHVGYYGGINYGFGYGGHGFNGGRWNNGVFVNKTVNVTNVTNRGGASFNGGPGGIKATPTADEVAVAHERHTPPTPEQANHRQAASRNHALLASVNRGKPVIAATPKAGVFSGKGVVRAKQSGKPANAAAPKHGAPEQAEQKKPAHPQGEHEKKSKEPEKRPEEGEHHDHP